MTNDRVAAEEDHESSYFGEDTFDDLIASALDGSSDVKGAEDRRKAPTPHRAVDATPRSQRRGGAVDVEEGGGGSSGGDSSGGDSSSNAGSGSDVASLDSDEITREETETGGEAKQRHEDYYLPAPLVNDDESTVDMRPPAPRTETVSSYVDQLNRSEQSKGRLIKAGAFAIVIATIVGIVLAVVSLTGSEGVGESQTRVATPANETISVSVRPTRQPATSTPAPTMSPKPMSLLATLTFENLAADHALTESSRQSIATFVEELLVDHLDDSFELFEVASYQRNGGHARHLASLAMPLRIVLKGPSNFSPDVILSYITRVITERLRNIENFLKASDWDLFQSVHVELSEIYYFNEPLVPMASTSASPQTGIPTASPSLSPQTEHPTTSPSRHPITWPSRSPQTEIPTASPSKPPEEVPPPVTEQPSTEAPMTPSPITKNPTENPTPRPTQRPTLNPTPRPTPLPSMNPTQRPTPKPTINPTPRPTPLPTTRPTFSPRTRPTRVPTRRPTRIPTKQPTQDLLSPGPPPSSSSNGYYCAKTSYTPNWNIMLDFECDLPCPSQIHTDCPGGYQCHLSDFCDGAK